MEWDILSSRLTDSFSVLEVGVLEGGTCESKDMRDLVRSLCDG